MTIEDKFRAAIEKIAAELESDVHVARKARDHKRAARIAAEAMAALKMTVKRREAVTGYLKKALNENNGYYHRIQQRIAAVEVKATALAGQAKEKAKQ